MKPDPSQRRPPPAGVLPSVIREGRRRRARGAVVAVAVLTLLSGSATATLWSGDQGESDTVLGPPTVADCPSDAKPFAGGLPAPPRGFDADAMLVPAGVPVAALICEFQREGRRTEVGIAFGGDDPLPLVRSAVVTSGLESVPVDLGLSRSTGKQGCGPIGGLMSPGYLVRLVYAEASVWLSTTQYCVGLTNGSFSTDVHVPLQFSRALDSGAWPTRPQVSNCLDGSRAGQEVSFVPAGWTGARHCVEGRNGQFASTRLTSDEAGRVVTVLEGLVGRPSDRTFMCPTPPDVVYPYQDDTRSALVVFDYPTGRSVSVSITHGTGCQAVADQGSLEADLTQEQLRTILAVLGET